MRKGKAELTPPLAHWVQGDALSCVTPLLKSSGVGRTVAFDADGTLWRGDIGEDFLRFIAATERYPALERRSGVYEEYERRVSTDPASAYAFAVEVMAGAREETVQADAEAFFEQRFRGRIYGAAKALIAAFQERSYEIYIVSASPLWPVKAGARAFGVPDDHVLAVTCAIEDGVLRLPVTQPLPCFEGKVQALKARGVRPEIAFGNGELDLPMLAYAERAVVIIPHGDHELRGNRLLGEALSRRWPVLRC